MRPLEISGTFDIECADWTYFVCGVTYSGVTTDVHRTPEDLLDFLVARGGTWWAHFGGGYDFLLLAELLRKRGARCQIDLSRSRVSRIVVGNLQLRDSFALVPMPLDKAATIAGERAPTLPWPCNCGNDCGGYCRITRRARQGDPELEAYCAEDCRVLYRVLHAVREHAAKHRLILKGTIGGTAWASAQRDLGLPAVDYPIQTWERIGRANFGGRDVIGRPIEKRRAVHYDIASAYPAALASVEIPIGPAYELGADRATKALLANTPGIYDAIALVPDDLAYPPLPVRVGGRVGFPTGLVAGSWCLPELLSAVERGCTIQQVTGGVGFADERAKFAPLIQRWYKIRRAVGRRSGLGEWMRLLANGLTGKLSQSPLRETIRMNPKQITICDRKGRCREGCTGRCGAHRPIGDGFGSLWAQPFFRIAESSHLHWAAYLRAACRVHLLEGIEASGEDDLIYCATDSVWTRSRTAPGRTGSTLGAWEFQHGLSQWECRARGTYRFVRDDGEIVIRAAGCGKMTDAEWRAGKIRHKTGVLALVAAAEQGRSLFTRAQKTWTLPRERARWYGDRILPDGATATRPCTIDEMRARV